ncbi:hypothetical protein GIB67_042594 [Kingdonia uniflora]|uniref:Uncharacterized protein n=1 Tax=Kingdonia uniflora TaxID=39325 RepID=A0A7J7M180_9MAGN|nr:hypothetical protein GIB67_042594 [Kingdonia uniflora]
MGGNEDINASLGGGQNSEVKATVLSQPEAASVTDASGHTVGMRKSKLGEAAGESHVRVLCLGHEYNVRVISILDIKELTQGGGFATPSAVPRENDHSSPRASVRPTSEREVGVIVFSRGQTEGCLGAVAWLVVFRALEEWNQRARILACKALWVRKSVALKNRVVLGQLVYRMSNKGAGSFSLSDSASKRSPLSGVCHPSLSVVEYLSSMGSVSPSDDVIANTLDGLHSGAGLTGVPPAVALCPGDRSKRVGPVCMGLNTMFRLHLSGLCVRSSASPNFRWSCGGVGSLVGLNAVWKHEVCVSSGPVPLLRNIPVFQASFKSVRDVYRTETLQPFVFDGDQGFTIALRSLDRFWHETSKDPSIWTDVDLRPLYPQGGTFKSTQLIRLIVARSKGHLRSIKFPTPTTVGNFLYAAERMKIVSLLLPAGFIISFKHRPIYSIPPYLIRLVTTVAEYIGEHFGTRTARCPRLQHFHLSLLKRRKIDKWIILIAILKLKELISMDVEEYFISDERVLTEIDESCTNFTRLKILDGLHRDTASFILKKLPNLKTLDLSNTHVYREFNMILLDIKELDCLDISGCGKLVEEDTIVRISCHYVKKVIYDYVPLEEWPRDLVTYFFNRTSSRTKRPKRASLPTDIFT